MKDLIQIITLNEGNIDNITQVNNLPSAFSIYSVFYNGKFITHEILSETKFNKVIGTIKAGTY